MFLDFLIPIFIVGLFVITITFKLIKPNYLLNKFKDEFYNLQGLLENLNEFNNKETIKFLEFEIKNQY